MKVAEIMERGVRFSTLESTLESVANVMWESDCGSVPVLANDGTPVGIITDRDIAIAAALNHKPLWELCAGDLVAGRTLYLCREDDDVHAALQIMGAQRVRRIPVIGADGQLRGVLSVDDVVAAARRGSRGAPVPELSFDDAVHTLKSVTHVH